MSSRLAISCVLALGLSACGSGDPAVFESGDSVTPPRSEASGMMWSFDAVEFSPDGSEMLVVAYDSDSGGLAALVRGGDVVRFTPDEWWVVEATWFPDSERVLVAVHEGDPLVRTWASLAVVSTDGVIVSEVDLEDRFRVEAGGFVVSPDGSTIVAAIVPSDDPLVARDLISVEVSSGEVRALTDTPLLAEGSPVFIDDGRIAYSQHEMDGGPVVGRGLGSWVWRFEVGWA